MRTRQLKLYMALFFLCCAQWCSGNEISFYTTQDPEFTTWGSFTFAGWSNYTGISTQCLSPNIPYPENKSSSNNNLSGNNPDAQELAELHFMNVTYGESTLILIPGNLSILVDGGYEQFGEKVYSYIKDILQKNSLDIMVCTHPHPDHIGGLLTIARKMKIRYLVTSIPPVKNPKLLELVNTTRETSPNVTVLVMSRNSVFYPVKELIITALHPQKITPNLNYSSLAFMLECYGYKILFGGDLDEPAEQECVLKFGNELIAHVLKLPHHGNMGYTGFIKTVQPLIGIISVGKNEWGAPALKTLEELNRLNTLVLRTDQFGNIILTLLEHNRIRVNTSTGLNKVIRVTR